MFGIFLAITLIAICIALAGIIIAAIYEGWTNKAHMWLTIGATIVAVIFSTILLIIS